MLRFKKVNQYGAILILVLLFLFVMTLLITSDSQEIIVDTKMQSAVFDQISVFARARAGMQQAIFAIMGKTIVLPSSSISVQTHATIIQTDACGNQTIDIQSVAQDKTKTVILNSRHIFATVSGEKNCEKMPADQMIWFQIEGMS